jgi:hypothetical protein
VSGTAPPAACRLAVVVLALLVALAPPVRAAEQPDETVLAQGPGGTLTAKAADAYADALEIALDVAGLGHVLAETERQSIREQLAAAFPAMSPRIQEDLAGMPEVVDRVRSSWDGLSAQERTGFALSVLTLAYGELEARRLLALPGPTPDDGGLRVGGYGADPDPVPDSDELCAIVPETCPPADPLDLSATPLTP